MEIIIYSLIAFPVFIGACFLLAKIASKEITTDSGEKLELVEQRITEIDSVFERAVDYAGSLEPLSLAVERRSREQELKENLNKELAKLADLEKRLAALQKQVEVAEESHNELKRGKEASAEIAKIIKERKKELEIENTNIKKDVESCLDEISKLSTKKKLTPDQNAGTKIIFNSTTNASKQLEALANSYAQASTRFLNLQNQFTDLEKEFTKLVEKELSE